MAAQLPDGPTERRHRFDVLVVGGGPAGAAAAYWLARAGHDVVVVERKVFPRDKTCGDGLTPRAVHQLDEMGLSEQLTKFHRYDGLRAVAHGRTIEMAWPEHPVFPSYGYVVRRRELDQFVAEHAVAAGATLWLGTEAVAPVVRDGLVEGATITRRQPDGSSTTEEVHARYVVIADGANSRFGRALGTSRNRAFPQGMAIRGYFESPLHADPWIESALDVRDRNGASLPGYGWVFPVGDGTINVGIGLLSTFRDFKSVNTSHLMTEWAHTLPAYWEIDPGDPIAPPTGGRLPMGGSINPKVGPTWIVVGDAAGSVNPFNGEGIDYAYETGRLAAELLSECLATGSARPLQRYPRLLDEEYGLYFKVARLFVRIIGHPTLMREMTRVGMQSRTLMEWVLRIMANLLRPDELGPAEAAYRAVATLARIVPERGAVSTRLPAARLPAALLLGAALLVATVAGGCTKAPTPGGGPTTTQGPSLPFADSPTRDTLADAAGLGFPDSVSDYRSVRVDPSELDVTFRLPTADVAAFVDSSQLGDLVADRRLIVHPSPLWDLDPGGSVQSATSVLDGITRVVEIVTKDGQDLVTVRLVVAAA